MTSEEILKRLTTDEYNKYNFIDNHFSDLLSVEYAIENTGRMMVMYHIYNEYEFELFLQARGVELIAEERKQKIKSLNLDE